MKEVDDNVRKPCIIPVPFEEGCYWRKGTKMGPNSVLDFLKDMREYSIDEGQLLPWNIASMIEEPIMINPYSIQIWSWLHLLELPPNCNGN